MAVKLDLEAAPTLTEVLCGRCRGSLTLDLADLDFADVAGMRVLRGRPEQRSIGVVAASEAVRRLSDLMGWDTDPGVAW
jgi:anti-anti-sigma regulatory factor